MPIVGMPELVAVVGLAISLGWYVGVAFMLFKIWNKVKHLPG